MGHLGLTPQSVQPVRRLQGPGRGRGRGRSICSPTPRSSPTAGCFALVLECMPAGLAARITAARRPSRPSASAPAPAATARCWSSTTCSACSRSRRRRFVKRYADLGGQAVGRDRRATPTRCGRATSRRRSTLPGRCGAADAARIAPPATPWPSARALRGPPTAEGSTWNPAPPWSDGSGALRARGPLVLVPTMGALHEGHLALVRRGGRATARSSSRSSSTRPSSDRARTSRATRATWRRDLALLAPLRRGGRLRARGRRDVPAAERT